MATPLANRVYRHLYLAQISALTGTGVMTVGLALLAYQLAGDNAGAVLGVALSLRIVAFVLISPLFGAYAHLLPRRQVLVALDLLRAATVLLLPFVDAVWQVYVLIFVINVCSAGFTPLFQATIPDVLANEAVYTRALSLSRLAYDLQQLLAPALAGVLLWFLPLNALFAVNAITFPHLRGAGSICGAAGRQESGSARGRAGQYQLGRPPVSRHATASGFSGTVHGRGGGDRDGDRQHCGLCARRPGRYRHTGHRCLRRLGRGLDARRPAAAQSAGPDRRAHRHAGWWCRHGDGDGWGVRLLRRSSHEEDRPALFAAQFALSHACWLVTYLVAGVVGKEIGLFWTFGLLGLLVVVSRGVATRLWPSADPELLEHEHATSQHEHLHIHDEHHQHEHEGWEGPEP